MFLNQSSSSKYADFDEDIIWAMKQRHECMKRINTDIVLPNLAGPGFSSVMKFHKETSTQTIATLLPDEVIKNVNDFAPKEFNGCLLSGKISGIVELMEFYDKGGRGCAHQLTKVLDRYLRAVIEEIMRFKGDVLSLSPDSFLVLWKSPDEAMLSNYVHLAINCAMVVQKKFGNFPAEGGIVLKGKFVVSAGSIVFSLLGHYKSSSYVYLGQPVEELETAEKRNVSGDVVVAGSAWKHVNPSEYSWVSTEDKEYNKILGISLTWKFARKEQLLQKDLERFTDYSHNNSTVDSDSALLYRTEDFSLRPIVLDNSSTKEDLSKFLIGPLLNAMVTEEPLESLEEMRQLVVMHLNVSMETVTVDNLEIVNHYYKTVCNKVSAHKGLVKSSSVSDGNVTFIVVFGMRGFTTVRESQEALRCAIRSKHELELFDEVHAVSISCSTGKCYCGVFGHPLRKDYAVFGRCVAESGRMVADHPGKITCDRQTFIYSNLDSENFIFLEHEDEGPMYEYTEAKGMSICRRDFESLPILGRDEEIETFLKLFRVYVENFGVKPCCNYSRCSFKNCLIFDGVYRQGKSRVLQELSGRVEEADVQMLNFYENDYMSSYNGTRMIMSPTLRFGNYTAEYFRRKRIKEEMGKWGTPKLLYALNDVFDVNFQVSNKNKPSDEEKSELRKESIKILCTKCFEKPTLILIDNADFMDEETWGLLPAMLETKRFFLVATIDRTRRELIGMEATLTSHHILKIALKNIPQIYLAGLACQMLRVFAIPADLEKAIQSNSKGNPGWIENFLLILQHTGKIAVATVDFKRIHEEALVAPPLYMLKRLSSESVSYYKSILEEKTARPSEGADHWEVYVDSCRDAYREVDVRCGIQEIFCNESKVPACLLAGAIDVDPNVTDDLNFLEVYDRLSFPEQQMLRCASVLGDPFTRRLLFFIWTPESQKKGGEVVQGLFEKGLVCCARGDFSSGGDYLLIRNKADGDGGHAECRCVGLDVPDDCLSMPKYASCGFMRFRSADFVGKAYGMIPDEERKELHARAAKFIKKETRRCVSCGCGYFPTQLGFKMDSTAMGRRGTSSGSEGKKKKSAQLERMDFEELFDYSTHVAGRTTITTSMSRAPRASLPVQFRANKSFTTSTTSDDRFVDLTFDDRHGKALKFISPFTIFKLRRHASLVRTFSKSDFLSCDCHLILNHMYKRLKHHYAGCEQWHDMIFSCIDYVRISLANRNYASCMSTIQEALDILENDGRILGDHKWKVRMLIAKFYCLKGDVLLELDQTEEAYKTLLKAMKSFGFPFPEKEKTLRFHMKLFNQKWRQKLRLYFLPGSFLDEERDVSHLYISNSISETLTNLCRIYMLKGMWKFAELAAVLSLKTSLKTETNLIRICESFTNMMLVAQHCKNKLLWMSLEVHALRCCHKKRNFVEAPELRAISLLYVTIFEARMTRAEFDGALQVGYIAVGISTKCNDMSITIQLLTLISMILLDKLIVTDSTTILRELEFFADELDNTSGRTWYYALAVLFHLETGYILTPFHTVEAYYRGGAWNAGDKYHEAKARLVVTMWVWYLRNGRWEEASMFKREVEAYRRREIDTNNHAITFLYVLEGTLLTLVDRINKRSISGMIEGKREVERLVKRLHRVAATRMFVYSKLYILEAYYSYILETEVKTKKLLNKARKYCKAQDNKLVLFHLEHLEKAWSNEMSSATRDFWKNHCKTDANISHHEMETENLKIYCYTYPKPLFRI